MIHLEYKLDYNNFGTATGNALLIVKQDTNVVLDVGVCKITEDQIERLLNIFCSRHGHVHVTENDATALFDYEYVCLDLENKLAEIGCPLA